MCVGFFCSLLAVYVVSRFFFFSYLWWELGAHRLDLFDVFGQLRMACFFFVYLIYINYICEVLTLSIYSVLYIAFHAASFAMSTITFWFYTYKRTNVPNSMKSHQGNNKISLKFCFAKISLSPSGFSFSSSLLHYEKSSVICCSI